MATIGSVKLPDNSTYDLTDNYSGYAKKVAGATTDDLASLTATGDLADSGKKLSDLVLKADVKDVLNSTSTTDPLSAKQGKVLHENIIAFENVYGAKNLIPFPYEGGMSYTYRGVTYTVSDKGIITTANTATNDGWYVLATNMILASGTYIIKGCPLGGSANTYRLTAHVRRSGGTDNYYYDIGEGYTFALNEGDKLYVTLNVGNGTDMDGLTFYPMLYDARILDPTFAPFAETNLQLTKKTSGLSNENLLDNPFFTVNQRGQNSYNSPDAATVVYTIDRWKVQNATLAVNSTGVTMTHNTNTNWTRLIQTMPPILGKTVTLSYKDGNGVIHSVSGQAEDGTFLKIDNGDWTTTVDFYNTYAEIRVSSRVSDSSITILGVKLELGSVSTLANDVEPNPTTELLKCQRYFYRILSNSSSAFMAVGFMADSHTFYGTINLPVPMRGTPTSLFGGVLQIYTTGGTEDVSTLLINMRSPQILTIAATIGNSLTVNSPAILMGVVNSYIDISADL